MGFKSRKFNGWVSDRSAEIQDLQLEEATDGKDTNGFYYYVKEVMAPKSFSIAPMRRANGRLLLNDTASIHKRCLDYCFAVLNRPLSANMRTIEKIEHLPAIEVIGFESTLTTFI